MHNITRACVLHTGGDFVLALYLNSSCRAVKITCLPGIRAFVVNYSKSVTKEFLAYGGEFGA